MDRNTDRWWYDRGYSLGSVEARRDSIIPKLIGAWILLGIAYVTPIHAAVVLFLYSVYELDTWRHHKHNAEQKREIHNPGKEWEYPNDDAD